jgi:organic hydroperoxide reductase OsmC/OhrA
MQELPHQYIATATAGAAGTLSAQVEDLVELGMAAPANFGGPGDLLSPEDLQVMAIASCLILSFRAVARASKLEWDNLQVETNGTLDKVDRGMEFTEFHTRATLTLPAGTSREKATRVLAKADKTCLITNSLKAEDHLEIVLEGGA